MTGRSRTAGDDDWAQSQILIEAGRSISYGICNRKNVWLLVGVSDKKLMPFVVMSEPVTGAHDAPEPRPGEPYSPNPLLNAGQLSVKPANPPDKLNDEAVICSTGNGWEEITTESIWPFKY